MTLNLAALALTGVAGLALGSFAVTSGLRMSRGELTISGRSRCDACGHTLGALETLPVVSYVARHGVCGTCGGRIDPTHLVGEVAGAAVLLSIMLVEDPVRRFLLGAVGLMLIATVAVDWRSKRLPDVFAAGISLTAAALAFMQGREAVLVGLGAATVSVGFLLALRAIRRRRGADPGLGLGDVKLISALALWLGLATPWAVVMASLLGLIQVVALRPAGGRLAFGPAIAFSAWAVGLAQESGAWPTM